MQGSDAWPASFSFFSVPFFVCVLNCLLGHRWNAATKNWLLDLARLRWWLAHLGFRLAIVKGTPLVVVVVAYPLSSVDEGSTTMPPPHDLPTISCFEGRYVCVGTPDE